VADGAVDGDQAWWDVFQDDQLRELIRTALRQNPDLRIAATRILQAQAQLASRGRISSQPSTSAQARRAAARAERRSHSARSVPDQRLSMTATAAWEIDFWAVPPRD